MTSINTPTHFYPVDMAYKSIGTFDTETLYELYDDVTPFFEAISEHASDISVMEVGFHDEPDAEPELWHDDYDVADGAWVEAGTFEDLPAAFDAAKGFPEGGAIGVFDYSDATAKLMVRKTED